MKKKNSKRSASSGLNTLMTTQMLAEIKGYKITKEQIEVVEPIYQKVSEILNLDVQTQKSLLPPDKPSIFPPQNKTTIFPLSFLWWIFPLSAVFSAVKSL